MKRFTPAETINTLCALILIVLAFIPVADNPFFQSNFMHFIKEILPFAAIAYLIIYWAITLNNKFKTVTSKCDKLKNRIIALNKLRTEENKIINRMLTETADRTNNSVKNTVELFRQLGIKNIEIRGDDKDTSTYKQILNEHLDEQLNPLEDLLDNWEDF